MPLPKPPLAFFAIYATLLSAGTIVRALAPLCGIAVLFTTLAYAHIIHHHVTHSAHADLTFWALLIPAIAAGILSLIGAFLLLKRPR